MHQQKNDVSLLIRCPEKNPTAVPCCTKIRTYAWLIFVLVLGYYDFLV